jgi:hypothetical protein
MATKNINDNEKAVEWFYGRARSASGYRKNIANNTERARDGVVIGKMFFFYYDPKTKDKLPIYDRFPLVFPIERYADGFLGLNLHYLSQNERSALLGQLMEYKTNSRMDERTRLRLSYDLLSSTKRMASAIRPCIKRYLFSHVRGRFIEVTSNEWQQAINLPVQLFVVRK